MADNNLKITVLANGPYIVQGGVPLVSKSEVMSEHGEPLTWKKGATLNQSERYSLCRCGQSSVKPFCDGSHQQVDFNGTETADPGPISNRETTYKGTKIHIKDDRQMCMHAGFCGNRISNVWKMSKDSEDTQVRAQMMSMIEKCPSGALAYTLEPDGQAVEPDLPTEIAVVPDGPLWISGGIPVERADGLDFEVRNRVTLCRCGASKNKPYCDGTHKDVGFEAD